MVLRPDRPLRLPLILWVNSLPHHMEFLKAVEPDPALSFLLLTNPEPTEENATISQLVDLNSLEVACLSRPASPRMH